jgi:hypothetical protein
MMTEMTEIKKSEIDTILKETWQCILESETEPKDLMKEATYGSATEVNEYVKRLGTYDYYTQPIALSPIICSYFGWEKDDTNCTEMQNAEPITLLHCAECKCYLAIEFHPQLTEESSRILLQKYKRMISTSHAKNCSFRSKGERWLEAEDLNQDSRRNPNMTKKSSLSKMKSLWANSIPTYSHGADSTRTLPIIMEVPMYLIPLSTEYTLLHLTEIDSSIERSHESINYNWKNHDAYHYLQSRSSYWMGKIQTIPSEQQNFTLSLIHLNWGHLFPPQVIHFIKSWWMHHVQSDFTNVNEESQIKNAMFWFYTFLLSFSLDKTVCHEKDALTNCDLDIHLDIRILTLFGWRHCAASSVGCPCDDPQNGSVYDYAYCPVCLATVKLPRIVKCSVINDGSIASPSRNRLIVSENATDHNEPAIDETAVSLSSTEQASTHTQRKRARSFDHYKRVKGSIKPSPPKRLKFTRESDEEEVWNSTISKIRQSITSNLRWSEAFHLIDNHRYYCPYASGFVSERMFPDRTDTAWEAILSSLFLFYISDDKRHQVDPHHVSHNISATFLESLLPSTKNK